MVLTTISIIIQLPKNFYDKSKELSSKKNIKYVKFYSFSLLSIDFL